MASGAGNIETRVQRVLVLGGYGAFGGRVAERLARVPGLELIIAGRSQEKAEAFASHLARDARVHVIPAAVDGAKIGVDDLLQRKPAVLINATGPYQAQDYRLVRTCIAAGAHYLDLADARAFVTGIGVLDVEARRAGLLAVSGASTVPGLSGAVVDAYRPQFASLSSVSTVISPGNSFDPGLATTQSILSTLGRPIASSPEGEPIRGWQGLSRRMLPGLGARWIGHCDAPDRTLFPQRYAGLKTADVYAALEVGMFHLGLWALSGLVRSGLLRNPEKLAVPLLAAKRKLRILGTDRGGMLVTMEGVGHDGQRKRIDWHIVARNGHGPYIPATASVLLAKRLLDGTLHARGAMPCVGLFTLDDFLAEIGDLDMTVGTA
jgi:NAD(P)-dependent dehydrogenase (short-subunit alcohol dehydrogenase family)